MDRRGQYGGVIAVTGIVLTAIQLVQGNQQRGDLGGLSGADQALVFLFGTAPFVLVGLTLVYAGYWLSGQTQYEQDMPRIVAWGVGSTVLFASVGALLLFSQRVMLGTLENAPSMVINQVTIGAVVGVLVGVYDARSRSRQREIERERDRIEAFAGKAADINNYGRELNRAASIDEVSALCIEGFQTLLGLTETAFVGIEDGEQTVINSTVMSVDDETLVELSTGATDNEQATVTIQDTPDGLDSRNGRLLTLLVTEHDGAAVVLLAFAGEEEFGEEDIQLLELLVSHAATALDRIATQNGERIAPT